MNDRDRNLEKQLGRLFEESRASLPGLEPDPGLPAHIRALAAARAVESRRAPAPRRWAWVSLAGAAFALSIVAGGYVGYQMWASSHDTTPEQVRDTDAFASALAQSGFADDLASNSEVQE